jgi:uncharacterized protein (DUF302 family)
MTQLGFRVNLGAVSIDQAKQAVSDALAKEGFGVLSEIDVQATLKKKLDVDMGPYLILGACNPSLAKRAIEFDPDVGLLLPCNVVLRQTPGGMQAHLASPRALFRLMDTHQIAPVADEAEERLRRVHASLGKASS